MHLSVSTADWSGVLCICVNKFPGSSHSIVGLVTKVAQVPCAYLPHFQRVLTALMQARQSLAPQTLTLSHRSHELRMPPMFTVVAYVFAMVTNVIAVVVHRLKIAGGEIWFGSGFSKELL